MSLVLKFCRRLSTASPLNGIALQELQQLRRDNKQHEAERALAFAELTGRMKQLSKREVPFFTVHQELPHCEADKLQALERFTSGLTSLQKRYLQYLLVLRMKHLQQPLAESYYSEIKPTVIREAGLLKTEEMALRLRELMLQSREELIALIK